MSRRKSTPGNPTRRAELTYAQANNCETAQERICTCRCGGKLHGARRAPVTDRLTATAWYEELPANDPHHIPSEVERASAEADMEEALRRHALFLAVRDRLHIQCLNGYLFEASLHRKGSVGSIAQLQPGGPWEVSLRTGWSTTCGSLNEAISAMRAELLDRAKDGTLSFVRN